MTIHKKQRTVSSGSFPLDPLCVILSYLNVKEWVPFGVACRRYYHITECAACHIAILQLLPPKPPYVNYKHHVYRCQFPKVIPTSHEPRAIAPTGWVFFNIPTRRRINLIFYDDSRRSFLFELAHLLRFISSHVTKTHVFMTFTDRDRHINSLEWFDLPTGTRLGSITFSFLRYHTAISACETRVAISTKKGDITLIDFAISKEVRTHSLGFEPFLDPLLLSATTLLTPTPDPNTLQILHPDKKITKLSFPSPVKGYATDASHFLCFTSTACTLFSTPTLKPIRTFPLPPLDIDHRCLFFYSHPYFLKVTDTSRKTVGQWNVTSGILLRLYHAPEPLGALHHDGHHLRAFPCLSQNLYIWR